MPISSLPSPYGIGTLGAEARKFVDFLAAGGQSCWQVLPLGPTSYGDSPYQSFSSFAGNPYFIDLDVLAEWGLLEPGEYQNVNWGDDPSRVNYEVLYQNRFDVLRLACARLTRGDKFEMRGVLWGADWLEDYALFMALKDKYGGAPWLEWPEDIRLRQPQAMEQARKELREEVDFWRWVQHLFYAQWWDLKEYANQKGVSIIGDLPIYVAMDSADVWAEPEFFQLGEGHLPTEVSGVPPDYFSADGQLWGNPLYNYARMEKDGFGWWIRRIEGAGRLFDIIRIDHFRGLESYWAVPYGAKTAKGGCWRKGPGMKLVGTLTGWFPDLKIIAEDLGFLTPEVHKLLADSKLPGMKVLEFAFDAREPSNYLPHTYERNCVCYVGTHDNETVMQWREQADRSDISMARKYLGLNDAEGFNWGMIRGGMSSTADTFVVQMQDCLGLGAEGRMNTPGKADGNWQWRLLPGEATPSLAKKLREYVRIYGR